ncbi:MAG: hypothetical protein PUB96_05540 [Helicobacteraceae bacterium]|nr:hypothetical protein [Helicobacteraceae bacterium]
MAVASDIKSNESITAKVIKDEVEEKFKNELATKDFVRAEIQKVRVEIQEVRAELQEVRAEIHISKIDIIKWIIGSQVAIASLVIAILKLF